MLFCLSYFFYSSGLMVWIIIFYCCRLLVIFLLFSRSSVFFNINVTYCQFISIYYLTNHYLIICYLITLKIYLVYSTISFFCYCWSNYVSPQFALQWKKNYLTFAIDTTHCDIELAFDYFVFYFSWVTLWHHP